ncbi:MAG: TetR/AcrR family transcriptional regulator [Actinomycetota bacterium]|nr:TetR/AcrR family transcriptional regulator [Actinomycetota bacterium]
MGEPSIPPRRSYDNRARREKAARTRERIVTAAGELVHEFDSWDWRELTFRAVAARAGVGERTVYRHFPSEQVLHDAVMQRLEQEAGITYEDVDLSNLDQVTSRVFAALQRFSVRESVEHTHDPTFASVEARRRAALRRSVLGAVPHWPDVDQRMAAGLLDVLWHVPAYERLVGAWGLSGPEATRAISWLMGKVVQALDDDEPPFGR